MNALYTLELADRICESIAGGKSLAATVKLEGMPSLRTVFSWLRDSAYLEFQTLYAAATEERAHTLAEQTLDIADETVDYVDTANGKHMDAAAVQNKRLRVDTRKWFAAKLLPRVYAEKQALEHSGPGGAPIPVAAIDAPDYDKLRAIFNAKYAAAGFNDAGSSPGA